jgi:hypothetical protein
MIHVVFTTYYIHINTGQTQVQVLLRVNKYRKTFTQKQTDETKVLRISNVQEPEQENLSILYYPCDLDEDHTKEKIIQKLVDHI